MHTTAPLYHSAPLRYCTQFFRIGATVVVMDRFDAEGALQAIEKHGITFPVMVDAPDLEGRSWGKTFKRYMIFGIPKEVRIDEKSHFVEIDRGYIGTGSQWLNVPED